MTTTSSARFLDVPALPDPSAHAYSHGAVAGDWLFIAGQCGVAKDGTISPVFREQALRVFERMELVLIDAGGSRADVVAMTVFVTDIRFGKELVELRSAYFGRDFPTSALIGVSALMPHGALVEVQAIAYIPSV